MSAGYWHEISNALHPAIIYTGFSHATRASIFLDALEKEGLRVVPIEEKPENSSTEEQHNQ